MSDIIRLLVDVAPRVHSLRVQQGLSLSELARRTGRSRDTLHRLERGEDVSVSTLLSVLAALGHGLALEPAGLPSLEDMRRRFAEDDDE